MADERILFRVEADTSQFDSGMSRAIASLQNFNSALKGMRDFRVPAPNMGDFNQGVSEAQNKVRALRSITSAEFQQVAGIAQSAFTNVKSGIGTLSNVASEYEMAMTRISKTSGWSNTSKEYATFRKELEQLSTTLPVTYNELGQISEIGAQMGIHSTGGLRDFTQELGRLVLATDMTAEASAKSIGHFAGAFQVNLNNSGRWINQFGATLVELGNTTNSSESEIMKLAENLSASGKNAGLSEQGILALSATLRSAGISAEVGGSAMSQVFGKVQRAVAAGGDGLETFAKIAGMSASEFAQSWQSDPLNAIRELTHGVATYKDGAIAALDELGIKNVREARVVQVLGNSYEALGTNIQTASKAWDNGLDDKLSASAKEVETFSNTFQAKMTLLKNRLGIIWSNIGQGINKAIISFMNILDPLITKFTEWSNKLVDSSGNATQLGQTIGALALTFTSLLGGITAFASASYVFNVLGGVFSKFTGQVLGFKNMFSGLRDSLASAGIGFNTLYSVIAIFISAIIDAWNNSKLFRNSVRDLGEALVSIATSIISGMQPALTLISGLFTGMVMAISSVLQVITPLISGIAQVIAWFLRTNAPLSMLIGSFLALQLGIPAVISTFRALTTIVALTRVRFIALGQAIIVGQFMQAKSMLMSLVNVLRLLNITTLKNVASTKLIRAAEIALAGAIHMVKIAQWAWNAAQNANPLLLLASIIIAAIPYIIDLVKWLGEVTGITKKLGKAFEWLGSVWKGVKSFFGFGDEAEEMKKDSEETSAAIDKMAESTQTSATEVSNAEFENGSLQELGDSAKEARYNMAELSDSVASSVSSYQSVEDGLNLSSDAVKNWQKTMSETHEHYTTDLNIFTNRVNDYFRQIPKGVKLGLDKGRLVVTGGLDGMSNAAKGKIASLIAMMNAEADANEFTFGKDVKLEGDRLVASLDVTSQRAQDAAYGIWGKIQQAFSDTKFDGVTFSIDQFGNVMAEGLENVDVNTRKQIQTMTNNIQQLLSSNTPAMQAAIIDAINTPGLAGLAKLEALQGQYSTQAGAIADGAVGSFETGLINGTPTVENAAKLFSKAVENGTKPNVETIRQNTTTISETIANALIANRNLPENEAKLTGEITSSGFFVGTELAHQAGTEKSGAFKDGVASGTPTVASTATQVKDSAVNNLADGNAVAQQHGATVASNYDTGLQTGGEAAKATTQNIGNQAVENLRSPFQNPNSFIDILTGFNASLEQSNTILEAGGKGGGTHYINGFKQAIETNIAGVFSSITLEMTNFEAKVTTMSSSVTTAIQTMVSTVNQTVSSLGTDISSGMTSLSDAINSNISSIKTTTDTFVSTISSVSSQITSSLQQMNHAFEASLSTMSQTVTSKSSQIQSAWNACMTSLVSKTTTGSNQMVSALSSGGSNAVNTVSRMSSSILNILNSMAGQMSSAGHNAGMGFYNGLASSAGSIYALANEIASNVASTMRRALDIHSPSRVTRGIGQFTGQGLVLGLSKFIEPVKAISSRLSQAISDNIYSNIDMNLDTILPNVSDVSSLASQTKQALQSSFSVEANQNYEINHTTVVQFGNRAYRMIVEDITAEQKRIARLESI